MKNLIIIFITLLFVSCSDFKVSDISCKNDINNCPENYFCNVEGKCVDKCTENSECLGGFACIEGKCKTSCEYVKNDCKNEYFCVNNECVTCSNECSGDSPFCFFSTQDNTIACCSQPITELNLTICYLKCGNERYSEYNQNCQESCNEMEVLNAITGNCDCKEGFGGGGCDNINECEQENPRVCNENTICDDMTIGEGNNILPYLCTCQDGFEENGNNEKGIICKDIDECTENLNNCDENAECTNTEGSFSCKCNDGYFGNGTQCLNKNECLDGSHTCDINAVCEDNIGSYKCTCNTGFIGDGKTCEDINECETQTVCDINATCINNPGDFTCSCNDGYNGDGFTCILSTCGNNLVQFGEECDGTNFDNKTCSTEYTALPENYRAGELACKENCSISTLNCRNTFQFGSLNEDASPSTYVDENGNIYMTVNSDGSLGGYDILGYSDIYLMKYNSNFELQWIKQFGTNKADFSSKIVIYSGNIYIGGNTFGTIVTSGHTNSGNTFDFFIAKFDMDGNFIDGYQFGSVEDKEDLLSDFLISGNVVYIAGVTKGTFAGNNPNGNDDAFLLELSLTANYSILNKLPIRTDHEDKAVKLFLSNNILYLTGTTTGSLATNVTNSLTKDIFLSRFNIIDETLGIETIQIRSAGNYDDAVQNIFVKNGIVYLVGFTKGYFNDVEGPENFSGIIIRIQGSNKVVKQLDISDEDAISGIYVTDLSDIYITGYSKGNFVENSWKGGRDIILGKYKYIEETGLQQIQDIWKKQYGTSFEDFPFSFDVKNNKIYLFGNTKGALDGNTPNGGTDIFITTFDLQ